MLNTGKLHDLMIENGRPFIGGYQDADGTISLEDLQGSGFYIPTRKEI